MRAESREDEETGDPSRGKGLGSGLFEISEATMTGRRCIHCGVDIVLDRVFHCVWCRLGPQCRSCNGLHETAQGSVAPCKKRPSDPRDLPDEASVTARDRAREELEEVSTVHSFEILDSASARTGEYLR